MKEYLHMIITGIIIAGALFTLYRFIAVVSKRRSFKKKIDKITRNINDST